MLKELEIIDTVAQLLGENSGIGDDAYFDPQTRAVYTTDILVENRHFSLSYFSPEDLGWKAMAVNLSDIAAMGAQPRHILVSLGLPEHLQTDFVRDLYKGMIALCEQTGCRVIGGDTVGSDHLVVNVTAIGDVPQAHTVGLRSQAQPGDLLITTGFHGLSAVGLDVLKQNFDNFSESKQAHLRPLPKIKEGLSLSANCKRYALMDSSDGLADAVLKIAKASNVCLGIDRDALPLHPEVAAYAKENAYQMLLYGGEDFQLVATLPESDWTSDLAESFTVVGRVTDGEGAVLTGDEKTEILTLEKTYAHFQEKKL